MRTNMHDIVSCHVDIDGVDGRSWLTITDESGNEFRAFVPLLTAQAMSEAFYAVQTMDAAYAAWNKAVADA